MGKIKLKLKLKTFREIYGDEGAFRPFGSNRQCDKNPENWHVELYLKEFKVRKNFNFDNFVNKLNYFFLVEYICAITDQNGEWFEETMCGYFCSCKYITNKMGYALWKKLP